MSIIKHIYTDGILKTDFKTAAVFIDGSNITTKTKFNIFNRNVLDLNQASDFTILYTLQVLKDEKRDQHLEGKPKKDQTSAFSIAVAEEEAETTTPIVEEKINNNSSFRTQSITDKLAVKDASNGIPIKEPTKNRSSITINGISPSAPQTFVRINGNLVTDFSKIELYLDGKKVKDANITIVIEIKKDSLLKYLRQAKK